MTRSHLTQELQNYFDIQDVRIRVLPYSLDAQILNAAAQQLELHQLRYGREVAGRFLSTCPLNLDNYGVYYQVQLPNSLPLTLDSAGLPLPPATVLGVKNGVGRSLSVFDDTLPVPSAAVPDPARSIVPLASPKLGSITTALRGVLENPGTLPIPNRLSFWVSNMGQQPFALDVVVTGERWPRTLWPGARQSFRESFTITGEGLSRSQNLYYAISSIEVFGLPEGGRVDVYSIEMTLPSVWDPSRPHTEWENRQVTFERYWQISGHSLLETYYKSPELGFPHPPLLTSQQTTVPLSDLAIEPFTFGAVAVADGTLYYFDRREAMPGSLSASALTAEPNYGLDVIYDDNGDSPRQVLLELQPYANAGTEVGYRFTVTMPDGALWTYYRDTTRGWLLTQWSSTLWSSGAPPSGVPFVLAQPGTYVFKLETRAADGSVLYDATPFLNRKLTPLAQFPLALPDSVGVGFDALGALWIWDGSYLQPYKFEYQAYAWDAGSRTLYLTQPFDSVQVAS